MFKIFNNLNILNIVIKIMKSDAGDAMSASNTNYQHLYKSKNYLIILTVILVGDSGVGKTHIVHR
jgi:hypothetical protein